MITKQIPVLIFFGATGTGKTALVESLFSAQSTNFLTSSFHGKIEVISCDSMQVYRGMDIGTAKPEPSLLTNLPHHLIDLIDPNQSFSSGEFVRLADEACLDIYARNKLPLICGGTGFYIKNFMYGLPITPKADETIRTHLQQRMQKEGAQVLMEELQRVDPLSAKKISIHDEYRIIRALEVYTTSGSALSSFMLPPVLREKYRFLLIFLQRPREELFKRIEERVEDMFKFGLIEEVQNLVKKGYVCNDPGMRAIGYREFFNQEGVLDLQNINKIKQTIIGNSKKYAKRQETFVKSLPPVNILPIKDEQAIINVIHFFYGT